MSNGAKMYDGDIKELIAGHDEKWTPDRAIKNINTGLLPILGRIADVYINAAQLADHEPLRAVFSALAQAYSSIVFTLGCVTGGNCKSCDDHYKECGIRVARSADALVQQANRIVQLKLKAIELQEMVEAEEAANEDDGTDQEPPEGAPVQ